MFIKNEKEYEMDLDADSVNGLYRIPETVYRNAPGVNQSTLKSYEENPAKFAYDLLHPSTTKAQTEGTILDAMVLTMRDFPIRIAPKSLNKPTRATKVWKAWVADQPRAELLKRKEAVDYFAMRRAVKTSPVFKRLIGTIDPDFAQISVFWKTIEGVLCKALIDYLDPAGKFAVDLKKMKDISLSGWIKANRDYRYYCQDGWYSEGLSKHLKDFEHFYFCTVCGTGPFDCVWRQLERNDAEVGLLQLMTVLPLYLKSARTGVFPSIHPETIQLEGLPNWSMHIENVREIF